MRTALIVIPTITVMSVAALAQVAYKPGPENVALPPAYQSKFVRYATVDKPDRKIVRFLYVNAEALDAAKAGAPLPDRTVVIMEDHAARLGADQQPLLDQQGRFIPIPDVSGIFVQEKREGWGIGYPANIRNGNWEYARFNADGSRHTGSVEACFTCHLKVRPDQDFAFNLWDYIQARKK